MCLHVMCVYLMYLVPQVIKLTQLHYLIFFILKIIVHIQISFFTASPQGEDGFPGFKGDMGIKGDRVSYVVHV